VKGGQWSILVTAGIPIWVNAEEQPRPVQPAKERT
jgi:hypothetical protein